jgi:hypothetical protein
MSEPYRETLRRKREEAAARVAKQRAEYEATLERLRQQFGESDVRSNELIDSDP